MAIGREEKIPEIIGLSGSSYILFKISSEKSIPDNYANANEKKLDSNKCIEYT